MQKLFKVAATMVVLADNKEQVSDVLNKADDGWIFNDSDILEVSSTNDLPDSWSIYSCVVDIDLVGNKDPWTADTIFTLLCKINQPKELKTPEERIAELEKEVEILKKLVTK